MAIQTGLARLMKEGSSFLDGKRIGLLVNPTAIDLDYNHAVDLFTARVDMNVTALFGPEHGVRGDAQDMISVDGDTKDARTGLPVYSLYGATEATLTPTREMLDEIDVPVYDVQDVGSRYYTFVWTSVLDCARAPGRRRASASSTGRTRSAASTSRAGRSRPDSSVRRPGVVPTGTA